MGHAAAPYSSVMSWLCCRISYSLLRSTVMCLRGARSHQSCPLLLGTLGGQVALSSTFNIFSARDGGN